MYPPTRVVDSKTVEGHATQAMAPSKRQEHAVVTNKQSKDSHDGTRAPPLWASTLLLSIEDLPHLNGVDDECLQQSNKALVS